MLSLNNKVRGMVTKPFLKKYFPVIGFPIAMFNCLSCKVTSPATTVQSIQIKSLSTALKALKGVCCLSVHCPDTPAAWLSTNKVKGVAGCGYLICSPSLANFCTPLIRLTVITIDLAGVNRRI
jgi:hypothetical protein